jgi:hypothetical protein
MHTELDRMFPDHPAPHPDTERLGVEIADWAKKIGIGAEIGDWAKEVSVGGDRGENEPIHFVATALVEAPTEVLSIAGRFVTWLFIFDDQGDLQPWPADYYTSLVQLLREGGAPDTSDPNHVALTDIRADIVNAGGAALLPELADTLGRYCDASLEVRRWNRAKTVTPLAVPPFAEYLRNRGARMTTEIFVVLQRLQLGLWSPGEPVTSLFRALTEMTSVLCGIENDLVSYHRDAGEGSLNLVDVLGSEHQLSLREAFAAGLAAYATLKTQIEALVNAVAGTEKTEPQRQQARSLLAWVAAAHHFHNIPRFAPSSPQPR